MSSVLKVDQIQKVNGSVPSGSDLGLNMTGSVLQIVNANDINGLTLSGNVTGTRFMNASITSKSANSSFLVRFNVALIAQTSSAAAIDSDFAVGLGYKTGSASTTSTDYTSISSYAPTRHYISFAGSQSRAFYSTDAFKSNGSYQRYTPLTTLYNEDTFAPNQAAGTVINVAAFVAQDGGNSNDYRLGGYSAADSGLQSNLTIMEIAG